MSLQSSKPFRIGPLGRLVTRLRAIVASALIVAATATGAGALDSSVEGKFVKMTVPFALNSLCQLQNGEYVCADYAMPLPYTLFFSKSGSVLYYMSDRSAGNDGSGMQFPASGGRDTFTYGDGKYIATYKPTSSGFDVTLEYDSKKGPDRWKFKLASRVTVKNGKCSSKTSVSGAFTTATKGWTPEGKARIVGKETCTVANSR